MIGLRLTSAQRTGLFRGALLALLVVAAILPVEAHAGRVTMFIYHRFDEARYPSTTISGAAFSAQLQYLADKKIPVVSLADVVDRLRGGAPLPEHAVVLTVDDAFDSFLAIAHPLLQRYGYPVTLFVNTDTVGHPGYLDWNELRGLAAAGVTIGNHTASHDYLLDRRVGEGAEAWRKRVREDVRRAQLALSRELSVAPRLFAYPYGEFSPELVAIIRELGFDAAVAQQSGVVGDGADLFTLPRFPMGGPYTSIDGFRDKLALQPLELELLAPVSPLLPSGGGDAPVLQVRLSAQRYDLDRLQGFVQGENRLRVEALAGVPGGFRVQAERPLSGRRNKYTLTVPLRGGGWAWFSQPWFHPQSALP